MTETNQTPQTYDPYVLINDVIRLLRNSGLRPRIEKGSAGNALGGAGMLLRALGVQPRMDAADAYRSSISKVWSEEDGLN
jgi:hypothetical protein